MAKYYNLSLNNLKNRLRAFKPVLNQRALQVIADEEDTIIQMITEEQLFNRGEDGRGVSIESYAPYKASTIKYKNRKNQPTDRVTLKDKGNFYKSLSLILDEQGFYIWPDKEKSGEKSDYFYGKRDFITGKYRYALRLSDENLKILIRDHIKPKLINIMRSWIINTGTVDDIRAFNKKYPKTTQTKRR